MTRHTIDTINSDQLDALYDELERLRAGEEPGWDPLIEPTPSQWIARWNRASAAERLHVAERIISNEATASRCFMMAHEKRLNEDRQAWVKVARVEDVLTDMEQITEARHWARILRKAIDGERPAADEQSGVVCSAYQPPTTAEMTGLCARCGMYDYKHQEATRA